MSLTIQDVLFYKSSGKKIDLDAILPFFILPGLLSICIFSQNITIIVIIMIGMGALYVQSRPTQRNRSPFFFSWTLASGILMFLVFEIGILGQLTITKAEHLVLLIFLSSMCLCFYKMKTIADFDLSSSKGKDYSPVLTADSYYCKICQIEVNDRFFHSIWWGCCILRQNYLYYMMGHILALLALLFGANLSLTSVCHSYIFYSEMILMPDDCSNVYAEIRMVLCFVTSVYALSYALVVVLVLIQQLLYYMPKYCEPQWRRLVNVLNV